MSLRNVKFEIRPEFRINMNNKNIGMIMPINEYEFYATTTDELLRFNENGIKTTYNYQFITAVYLKDLEMIIGVTYIGSELVLLDIANPQRPLISGYKLNMVGVFHIVYSPASKSIIIFGSGIKVYYLNILNQNYRVLKKPEDFSFTPRSSFASWYETLILNPPVFDYDRELIFLPTNNGLAGFNLDGKQTKIFTKLPLLKNSLYSYYPNSRKLFVYDNVHGSMLWDRYSNMVSRYSISSVISSVQFVDNENVFYLNPKGYLSVLNLKTQRSFVLNTIEYQPTRIFMFNYFKIPTLIICNGPICEFYTIRIPWKVWARHVLHTTSIERVPALNAAARILIFTKNSFAKIYSPKNAHMLTSATPFQSSPLKDGFYDRGLIVYNSGNQRVIEQLLENNEKRDQIFMLLENYILTCFSTGASPCDQIKSNKMKFDFIVRTKYKGGWSYCFATKQCDLVFAEYSNLRLIRRYLYGSKRTLVNLKYVPATESLLLVCTDSICLIETEECKMVSEIQLNQPTLVCIHRDIAFLGYQTGCILCVTCSDNKLELMNAEVQAKYHDAAITGFSFSDTFWVSSSLDQTIKLWNYEFINLYVVRLPLPILNCCILNGYRDILVATDSEIMILKGKMFFGSEIDEEVKELDNYDTLEDELAEYCIIPGDFDEEENKETSLLTGNRNDSQNNTGFSFGNQSQNVEWKPVDPNLLKEKESSIKVNGGSNRGSRRKNKVKYESLSTAALNNENDENNSDKNKNDSKDKNSELSESDRAALLAEMGKIEDKSVVPSYVPEKKEDDENQKAEEEEVYDEEEDKAEKVKKKKPKKVKKRKSEKQNQDNNNENENQNNSIDDVTDFKIEMDDNTSEDDNFSGARVKPPSSRKNVNYKGAAPRKITQGPQSPSARPKKNVDGKTLNSKSKDDDESDEYDDENSKNSNDDDENEGKSRKTKKNVAKKSNKSGNDGGNNKKAKNNKNGNVGKNNKNNNDNDSDDESDDDGNENSKSKKGGSKGKGAKKGSKNARKKTGKKNSNNDSVTLYDKKPIQIPEDDDNNKKIRYHKSVSSLNLRKEPEIPVKNVKPHRASTPPLVIKLHPYEKDAARAIVLDREQVIEKFIMGDTEVIDLLKDATRGITATNQGQRNQYDRNVESLHQVIDKSQEVFEKLKVTSPRNKSKTKTNLGPRLTPKTSNSPEKSPRFSRKDESKDSKQKTISNTTKTEKKVPHSKSGLIKLKNKDTVINKIKGNIPQSKSAFLKRPLYIKDPTENSSSDNESPNSSNSKTKQNQFNKTLRGSSPSGSRPPSINTNTTSGRGEYTSKTFERLSRPTRIETLYKRKQFPLSLVTVLKTPEAKQRQIEYDTSLVDERRAFVTKETREAAEKIIRNLKVFEHIEVSARVVVHKPINTNITSLDTGIDLLEAAVCEHLPDASPHPLNSVYMVSPRNKKRIYKSVTLRSKSLAQMDLSDPIFEANKYELFRKSKPMSPRIISPHVNPPNYEFQK